MITSQILVNDLYKILTSQISNPRFYKARARGFRNELNFEKILHQRQYKILDAGQFLFTKKNSAHSVENEIIYVTVSDDDKDKYLEFYAQISRIDEIKNAFFVSVHDLTTWKTEPITIKNEKKKKIEEIIVKPEFSVYKFNDDGWISSNFDEIKELLIKRKIRISAKKSREPLEYLEKYDFNELAKVYANRYFLDIELISYNKGMMDFDHIVLHEGKFVVVETKEKDPMRDKKNPSDTSKWAFGWDSRRFGWYFYLKHKIELDSWYVIGEIKEQTNREFVGWKKIEFDKFCKCISWLAERSGGGGGGTMSAPYLAFDDF